MIEKVFEDNFKALSRFVNNCFSSIIISAELIATSVAFASEIPKLALVNAGPSLIPSQIKMVNPFWLYSSTNLIFSSGFCEENTFFIPTSSATFWQFSILSQLINMVSIF